LGNLRCNEIRAGEEAQGDNLFGDGHPGPSPVTGDSARDPKGAPVVIGWDIKTVSVVGAAAAAALLACAPLATADPAPDPVPLPAPVLPGPVLPAAPVDGAPVQPLAGDPAVVAAPAPVPHLSSPENLPPGTTETPTPQTKTSYLRDLWHAMRTQEVSGSDALLLLTQRPMSNAPTAAMSPMAPMAPAPAPAPLPAPGDPVPAPAPAPVLPAPVPLAP
jgi:hypothetical protein